MAPTTPGKRGRGAAKMVFNPPRVVKQLRHGAASSPRRSPRSPRTPPTPVPCFRAAGASAQPTRRIFLQAQPARPTSVPREGGGGRRACQLLHPGLPTLTPPSFAWPLPVPESPELTPLAADTRSPQRFPQPLSRCCQGSLQDSGYERTFDDQPEAFAFWPQSSIKLGEDAESLREGHDGHSIAEAPDLETPASLQSAGTQSPTSSFGLTLASKARLRLHLQSPPLSDEATTDQQSTTEGIWSSSPSGTCSYSSSGSSYEDDVDPSVPGARDAFWSPLTTPMLELLDDCRSSIPTRILSNLAPEPECVPRPPSLVKRVAARSRAESVDCAFKAVVAPSLADDGNKATAGVDSSGSTCGGCLNATLGSTGGCGTPRSPRLLGLDQ